MRESGIYNKWEVSYLNRWRDESSVDDELVGYKVAYIENFFGLFTICTGMIGIGFGSAFLEIMKGIKKKCANNNY